MLPQAENRKENLGTILFLVLFFILAFSFWQNQYETSYKYSCRKVYFADKSEFQVNKPALNNLQCFQFTENIISVVGKTFLNSPLMEFKIVADNRHVSTILNCQSRINILKPPLFLSCCCLSFPPNADKNPYLLS